MNRFLFAAVVGLMAVGATGCATGVEDPQPAPAPVTQSRGAPATPFSAEVPDDSTPDPALIGNGGLDAPKPFQTFDRPVPSDGSPADDTDDRIDPTLQVQTPIPVNGG